MRLILTLAALGLFAAACNEDNKGEPAPAKQVGQIDAQKQGNDKDKLQTGGQQPNQTPNGTGNRPGQTPPKPVTPTVDNGVASPGRKYARQGEALAGACIALADNKIEKCWENYLSNDSNEENCKDGSNVEEVDGKKITFSIKKAAACPANGLVDGCAFKNPDNASRLGIIEWNYLAPRAGDPALDCGDGAAIKP